MIRKDSEHLTENFLKLKALEGQFFTQSNSKAGQWLHYKLLLVEPGYIEASVFIKEELTNPSGQLHGGMIGLIADELCGLSFYSLGLPTFYTTVSLNINYLSSVDAGKTVIIKANVLRSGQRMANVECYIYDEDEKIVAHATSNLMNSGKAVFNLTKKDGEFRSE